MEEIFADRAITVADVIEIFEALFPGLTLFEWDPWGRSDGNVEPIGYLGSAKGHVLCSIYYESDRVEFQWRISIDGTPIQASEARSQVIAERISARYNMRTLVSYQLPEEPHDPYYVLVYVNGACYLADDSMFSWTGDCDEIDNTKPIMILKQHEPPVIIFDECANDITT